MTRKELLQDLADYPKEEGVAIHLARGVIVAILPEYAMLFFDDSLELIVDCTEVKNVGKVTPISVKSLRLSNGDNPWNTFQKARTVARRIVLGKENGEKIRWWH
ncbi:hypothetical protein KJ761_03350 [Patescibacteria group bacterium]|nr:hypothetical protein [Patescibacteria group bacterium]